MTRIKKVMISLKKSNSIKIVVGSLVLLFAVMLLGLSVHEYEIPIVSDNIKGKLYEIVPLPLAIEKVTVRLSGYKLDLTLKNTTLTLGDGNIINLQNAKVFINPLGLVLRDVNLFNFELENPSIFKEALLEGQAITAENFNHYLMNHFHKLDNIDLAIVNKEFIYQPTNNLNTKSIAIFIKQLRLTPVIQNHKYGLNIYADLLLEELPVRVLASLLSSDDLKDVVINSHIENANLYDVAKPFFDVWFLKESNIPLHGTLIAKLSSLQEVHEIDIKVESTNAYIKENYFFPSSIDLKNLSAQIKCKNNCSDIRFEQINLYNADFNIVGDGATEKNVLSLNLNTNNILLSKVLDYWPHVYAVDAKAWIKEHIKDGIIDKAVINLAFDISKQQTEATKKHKANKPFTLTAVLPVTATLTNIEGIPEISNIAAVLKIDNDNVKITSAAADIIDFKTSIENITANIANIQSKNFTLALEGHLKGDVKNLISLTRQITKAEFDSNLINAGTHETKLKLNIPIYKDHYTFNEIDVNVQNKLHDIQLGFDKYNLTNAELDGAYNNNSNILSLNGYGLINGIKAHLDWQRNLLNDKTNLNILFDNLPVDKLPKLDIPAPSFVSGEIDANLAIASMQVGHAAKDADIQDTHTGQLDIDLSQAQIQIPLLSISKNKGKNAHLKVLYNYHHDLAIEKYEYKNSEDNIYGEATFHKIDNIFSLSHLILNRNSNDSQKYVLEYNMQDNTINLDISGSVVKMPQKLASNQSDNRVILNIEADKFILHNDIPLHNAQVHLDYKNGAYNDVLLSGSFTKEEAISIKFDGTDLKAYSQNAGQLLNGLGITNKIHKGDLSLIGLREKDDINAVLRISKFNLRKTGAILKILGLISLTNISFASIKDILRDEGIKFNSLTCDIKQSKNHVIINKCKFEGPSMAIVAKGQIDLTNDLIKVQGTLLPNSIINEAIRAVPIVGDILSSKDQAFLGVNFEINGNIDEPKISSNPLSIFTPGEMRKIFQQ